MKNWTRWHRPIVSTLPDALSDWLMFPGSLTRRLQTCFADFSVRQLHDGWRRPLIDEALLVKQPLTTYSLQREVFLQDGTTPLVYARTVVPRETYQVMPQRFDTLGNRPLGELLFNHDPLIVRGPIEVARLQVGQALYQAAVQALALPPSVLWARRSCFYLAGKPILVNEVFLPSAKWSDL